MDITALLATFGYWFQPFAPLVMGGILVPFLGYALKDLETKLKFWVVLVVCILLAVPFEWQAINEQVSPDMIATILGVTAVVFKGSQLVYYKWFKGSDLEVKLEGKAE